MICIDSCYGLVAEIKMNSVFISYSSKDRDFASRLANDLKSRGISVWFDQWELKAGESLTEKIGNAIKAQDYLIAILSRTSVKSAWVMKELGTALIRELEERRVVVLPLIIEDCDIPPLLSDKVYIDFRINHSLALKKLLDVFPGNLFPSGISIRELKEQASNVSTGNVVNTNVIDAIGNNVM